MIFEDFGGGPFQELLMEFSILVVNIPNRKVFLAIKSYICCRCKSRKIYGRKF